MGENAVELSAVDLEEVETAEPEATGFDVDEARATLLRAASQAEDAPKRVKDAVSPPKDSPTLRMPAPIEIGPPGHVPLSVTAGVAPRGGAVTAAMPARKVPGAPSSGPVSLPPVSLPPVNVPVNAYAELVELLEARIARLTRNLREQDKLTLARAHLELAALDEVNGEGTKIISHVEAALRIEPSLVMGHALLRRARHSRQAARLLLEPLEREIAATSQDGHRADLLAEKARLMEATGEKAEPLRAAWEAVLAVAPNHPAALKGLEAALTSLSSDSSVYERLAAHLGRMSEAYAPDAKISAWLKVEQARILDRKLAQRDAAWGALKTALAQDGGVGPVRAACVRHAARHADFPALFELFINETAVELVPARLARLELDAAILAAAELGEIDRAIALLESARSRAPTSEIVDRRVLDLLVRLYESKGATKEALVIRRARLSHWKEPRAEAYELRLIAAVAEREGHIEEALADVERARGMDEDDATLLETMDRLLAKLNREEQRARLWAEVAARTTDAVRRSRLLLRASKIAEGVGRHAEAIHHLRTALAATPADAEVVESLSRLLTQKPQEAGGAEIRARIAIYTHAAEGAADNARRIGYLEKVALLWEEFMGEPELASRAYADVLALDPDRRTAILGLQRTAARTGNVRALAKGLFDEARLTSDERVKLDLATRAATALAMDDPDRALVLVQEVLKKDPAHEEARALEMRLHEVAGRWEQAVKSMTARIDVTKDPAVKVHLLLSRAEMEQVRLGRNRDALTSLRAVRALDPSHPVPPDAIPRLLDATGDFKALRDALIDLAQGAATPLERVRHLARAAEIDELELDNAPGAASLYAKALEQAPSEPLLLERLTRLAARLGPLEQKGHTLPTGLAADPGGKLEGGGSAGAFERAMLLVEAGCDPSRAIPLLEGVIARDVMHIPALRTMEVLARQTGSLPLLANAVAQEADALGSPVARLGALWAMAHLIEWKLPDTTDTSVYQRILDYAPMDRNALDAIYRRTISLARKGDGVARVVATSALMSLLAHAPDDTGRLVVHLQLALLNAPLGEAPAGSSPHVRSVNVAGPLPGGLPNAASRAALDHFRTALRIDAVSVTAATGTARYAAELRDGEAGIASSMSLAELASDPKVRARYLLDAADLLLATPDDPRMGTREQRRTRAADLLEQALDADPESLVAAGRLANVRAEDGRSDRLVESFRKVIHRAKTPGSIVMLGTEIARLARSELNDLTTAIDAMRRVREVAPDHVPSLLTLAELYIAQRAWQEAAHALEAVVKQSREVGPKLTALFALSDLYERALSRPEAGERVLRAVLEADANNSRALRQLTQRLRSRGDTKSASELPALLDRLAQSEPVAEEKAKIYVELCDLRLSTGDRTGAEKALTEAVAWAPSPELLQRLSSMHSDLRAYATSLATAVKRSEEVGRPSALSLATLGELEVELLNRVNEGLAHLRAAVVLAPAQHETRCEFAAALQRAGQNDEAAKTILQLIMPDSRPLLSLRSPQRPLELLERALAADRHSEEALVVREVRSALGFLDDASQLWLRQRRLAFDASNVEPIDRGTLMSNIVPPEGRHVLVDVALALSGVEGKLFRSTASDLGITSRDRVGPRSGHPLRSHFERLTWLLRIPEAELYVSDAVGYTRVVPQDVPWVVAPQSLLEQSDSRQTASLARALTRVALGVSWLEDLPPAHVHALLTVAARHGNPNYASDLRDRALADLMADYEPRVTRAIGRRQRKQLGDLAHRLDAPRGPTPHEFEALILALYRAELRVSFLVTGDLLAALDELKSLDGQFAQASQMHDGRAAAALFSHPLAGDLVRYALSKEATTVRWRTGTVWGPAALGAVGR